MPGKNSDKGRRTFEELAVSQMRERGHRITSTRLSVIRALAEADRPLSPQGIHTEVSRKGGRMDVVSVYRILAMLGELGLVHHIGLVDGYVACTFGKQHGDETQHVVCNSCGHVWELPLAEGVYDATKALLKRRGIRAVNIKVEITATCDTCSKH